MTTTTTASGFANVNEMCRDAIYAMPVDYDWTEHTHGEDWDFIEYRPPEEGDQADCAECNERVYFAAEQGEWHHVGIEDEDADHDAAPDAEYAQDPDYCEGPMMSYWYPVEIRSPEVAAERIADLPVCRHRRRGDRVGADRRRHGPVVGNLRGVPADREPAARPLLHAAQDGRSGNE